MKYVYNDEESKRHLLEDYLHEADANDKEADWLFRSYLKTMLAKETIRSLSYYGFDPP